MIGAAFDLIISDAYGSTTTPITFTLQDGEVTANILSSMGAGTGPILKYNGTTWVPSDLSGLTYAGTWDADTNNPDLSQGGQLGEFFIVNVAGATNLMGGPGTDNWAIGDWAVWNDVTGQWKKVDNATHMKSFNGRNGVVAPQTGNYTWAQIDKTASSLADMADVDNAVSGITASQWTTSGSNVYYSSGNVGIGTSSPGTKLEVAGQVKITGGSPGAGKVLTSDDSGLATWQTPSGGVWSQSGDNISYVSNANSTKATIATGGTAGHNGNSALELTTDQIGLTPKTAIIADGVGNFAKADLRFALRDNSDWTAVDYTADTKMIIKNSGQKEVSDKAV